MPSLSYGNNIRWTYP